MDDNAPLVQLQAQAAAPDALEQLLQPVDEQQGQRNRADAGEERAEVSERGRGHPFQQPAGDEKAGDEAGEEGHKDDKAQAAMLLVGVEDDGVAHVGGHAADCSTAGAA
jgi:hypothetical protein